MNNLFFSKLGSFRTNHVNVIFKIWLSLPVKSNKFFSLQKFWLLISKAFAKLMWNGLTLCLLTEEVEKSVAFQVSDFFVNQSASWIGLNWIDIVFTHWRSWEECSPSVAWLLGILMQNSRYLLLWSFSCKRKKKRFGLKIWLEWLSHRFIYSRNN